VGQSRTRLIIDKRVLVERRQLLLILVGSLQGFLQCFVPHLFAVGNKNKMTVKKPLQLSHSRFQSALTTGRDLLQDVDGRSAIARRYRDLNALFVSDLGGERANLSAGQLTLVRRASCLTVELERLESTFAKNGGAKSWQLELYQRTANSLRRLLESLNIHRGRVARDVTPTLEAYLASKRDDEDDTEDAA
jgi:hypothetical protein